MNDDLITLARAEICEYLEKVEEEKGLFDYFGYVKTNPERKNGFEEYDCKVVLPGLNTRRVRNINDADEMLCKEITDKVLSFCGEIIKENPCTRIIVTKNGSLNVEIGR